MVSSIGIVLFSVGSLIIFSAYTRTLRVDWPYFALSVTATLNLIVILILNKVTWGLEDDMKTSPRYTKELL